MERGIVQVGIDLGGVQIAVPKYLLQGTSVHTVFEHQGRRRVAQLMRRVATGIQAGLQELFLHHLLNTTHAESAIFLADKQGILSLSGIFSTFLTIK